MNKTLISFLIVFLFGLSLLISNYKQQNSNVNIKSSQLRENAPQNQILAEFQEWQVKFGKKYQSKDEELVRFEMFSRNLEFINNFNAENNGIVLAVNKFTDQSPLEFSALNLNRGQTKAQGYENMNVQYLDINGLPTSVNWLTQGAVTPVKDQGQCGSCWAFSTVGGLEGIYEIKSKKLVSLSEQQIVDCSHNGGNQGCNGGDLPPAYQYTIKYGIESEVSYPYKGVDGKCQYNKANVVFTPTSFTQVPENNSDQLAAAVVNQPISVCIEADSNVFQSYSSGVLTSASCGTDLDHCVTLIGYQDNASTPYWIVKNSWGTSWGQNGYVWIEKQSGTGPGICGIAEEPVYPNWTGQQIDEIQSILY